jgi:hypothetical protein
MVLDAMLGAKGVLAADALAIFSLTRLDVRTAEPLCAERFVSAEGSEGTRHTRYAFRRKVSVSVPSELEARSKLAR